MRLAARGHAGAGLHPRADRREQAERRDPRGGGQAALGGAQPLRPRHRDPARRPPEPHRDPGPVRCLCGGPQRGRGRGRRVSGGAGADRLARADAPRRHLGRHRARGYGTRRRCPAGLRRAARARRRNRRAGQGARAQARPHRRVERSADDRRQLGAGAGRARRRDRHPGRRRQPLATDYRRSGGCGRSRRDRAHALRLRPAAHAGRRPRPARRPGLGRTSRRASPATSMPPTAMPSSTGRGHGWSNPSKSWPRSSTRRTSTSTAKAPGGAV